MRVLLLFVLLVLSGLSIAGSPQPPNEGIVDDRWALEDLAWTVSTTRVDIAISAAGTVNVVFDDGTTITVLRRVGPDTWIDLAFPFTGDSPSIDVDPVTHTVHVLYRDATTGNLMLAKRVGVITFSWITDVAYSDVSDDFSFAMNNDTAHIAISAGTDRSYRQFDPDGFSFSAEVGAAGSGMQETRPAIALRSDGVPRIAYSSDDLAYYAFTTDGITWTVLPRGAGNRFGVALTLDSLDGAALAVPTMLGPTMERFGMVYHHQEFGSWLSQEVDIDGGDFGVSASVALDPESESPRIASWGAPCWVCFSDYFPAGDFFVTYPIVDVAANSVSLAVAPNRMGFIAFNDTSNGIIRVAAEKTTLFNDGFESNTMTTP